MSSVSLICCVCGKSYDSPLNFYNLKKRRAPFAKDYCSQKCFQLGKNGKLKVNCDLCGKEFSKRKCQIRITDHNFCSYSCAAIYRNNHKTVGTRRSKLEIWLEEKLIEKYSNLDVKFNSCKDIGYELDIYIPSLNLAFELNGPVHYQPIYGQARFSATQNIDNKKVELCRSKNIELIIIDVSNEKLFKEKNGINHYNNISLVIDDKIYRGLEQ